MVRLPRGLVAPAVLAVAGITAVVLFERMRHDAPHPPDGNDGSGGPNPSPAPPTPAAVPSPAPTASPVPTPPTPTPAPPFQPAPQPPHGNNLLAGIYWNAEGAGPSSSVLIAQPRGTVPAQISDENRTAVQHIYQAWDLLSAALDDPAVTDVAGRLPIELNMLDAPAIDQFGNVDVPRQNVYAGRDHDVTSELMPVDVALHELVHRVHTTTFGVNVGLEPMDLDQQSVLEGVADAVSMSLTHDWKIGEDYCTPASSHQSIRNAALSIDDDYVSGVATDYREVARMLQIENTDGAALQQMIQEFTDYDARVRMGGRTPTGDEVYREQQMNNNIESASMALESRTSPYSGDQHEYGSIIPRAFRELQLRAGWNATEQVARAIMLDATLWDAHNPPHIADVFQAMRRSVADAPAAEREQMDAALEAVHAPAAGDATVAGAGDPGAPVALNSLMSPAGHAGYVRAPGEWTDTHPR